jgi:hypothetical protein
MAALVSGPAMADWRGEIEVALYVGSLKGSVSAGKIRVSKMQFRIELGAPASVVSVADAKLKRMWVLNDKNRTAQVIELKGNESEYPVCDVTNINDCFRKLNFKLVGEETLQGVPCEIYSHEFEDVDGVRVIRKYWKPKNMREVAAIRIATYGPDGPLAETIVSNVTYERQRPDFFRVPSRYLDTPLKPAKKR